MQLMIALVLLLAPRTSVEGCTYFEIPQKENGGLVIGRSMELGDILNMRWRVAVHPRRPGGVQPLGYVSVDGLGAKWLPHDGYPLQTEGLNELGLSVSANTFHASVYERSDTGKKNLLWWEVVPFLLGNFGNVSDALQGLKQVAVTHAPRIACSIGACFHWALADSSGESAVVEFINGQMQVWQGKQHVGVMTNDPSLDWMITNLNQYVNLRPDWPKSNEKIAHDIGSGVVPSPVGHGFNLLGLPGDASPASRFVRVFYLREYALASGIPQSSTNGTITLATGLLNNVYLLKGTIAKSGALDALEYTPWAVVKVPRSKVFLYRTALDMAWKQIDLLKVDFDAQNVADIPLSMTDLGVHDVTHLLTRTSSLMV
jgi:choloylglycine hydrolase